MQKYHQLELKGSMLKLFENVKGLWVPSVLQARRRLSMLHIFSSEVAKEGNGKELCPRGQSQKLWRTMVWRDTVMTATQPSSVENG